MITPLKQNTPAFVTPGAEKPDLANGPYLKFNGDNGAITYIQMTNDRALWFKQVSAEGILLNVTTYDADCSKCVTDYLAQRLKETGECNV